MYIPVVGKLTAPGTFDLSRALEMPISEFMFENEIEEESEKEIFEEDDVPEYTYEYMKSNGMI
jgi:hypothetical protein